MTTAWDTITLGEALGVGSIEIREVSEGGSVPELRVVNHAGVDGPYPGRAGTRWLQIKSNRQHLHLGLVSANSEIVIPIIRQDVNPSAPAQH